MSEPGLDRHEWETEWAALEPLVQDSPGEALPELNDLIERIMVARGYPIEEDDADLEAAEPEIVGEFREAHRISLLVEGGGDVDPGDIASAVNGFRTLYASLLADGFAGPS